MARNRCNLAVYLPGTAAPLRVEGVMAAGMPPDELHVWLTPEHVQMLFAAGADIASARAARGATKALSGVVGAFFEGLAKGGRRRKLRG